MKNDIDLLFDEVDKIAYSKKERESAAQKRGEKFNIFELLGLQANETRLHSALIAEMLNPNGSHGLGEMPLRIFITEVCGNYLQDFNVKDVEVIVEHIIGNMNGDYTSGGRIDILIQEKKKSIQDKGRAIIIENKIYADDQQNQMIRYSNYAKSMYSSYQLCYLTLDGHIASEKSAGKLKIGEDYFVLSYRDDIMDWLNKCRLMAIDKPLVREVLGQYIATLKYLTNINMTEKEKASLFNAMENRIEATAEILSVNQIDFTGYLVRKYILPNLKTWATYNNLQCENLENFATGKANCGISFTKREWTRSLGLQFQKGNFGELICGVTGPTEIFKFQPEIRLSDFKKFSDVWHYGYGSPRFNSLTPDVYPDIKYGKVAEEYVKSLEAIYQEVINNPAKFPMV